MRDPAPDPEAHLHPAERRAFERGLLGEAIRGHPAMRRMAPADLPLPYLTPDVIGLDWDGDGRRVSYRLEDPTWWRSCRTPREARILAIMLVDEMRAAIRAARRAGTAAETGTPAAPEPIPPGRRARG